MPQLYRGLAGLSTPLPQSSRPAMYEKASEWLSAQVHATGARAVAPALSKDLSAPALQHNRLDHIKEQHVFFDVETNGLGKNCLAVQLSFLVTQINGKRDKPSLEVIDFFDGCFAVPSMSPMAQKIHGISLRHLDQLQSNGNLHSWDKIGPRFLQHCEEAHGMVGHNVSFDIRSITETLAYHNLPDTSKRFAALAQQKKNCTLQMARAWTKDETNFEPTEKKPSSHKLTELYSHIFKRDLAHAHDAAADTLATAALFFHLKSANVQAKPSSSANKTRSLEELVT